jgi:hypothetical protein
LWRLRKTHLFNDGRPLDELPGADVADWHMTNFGGIGKIGRDRGIADMAGLLPARPGGE